MSVITLKWNDYQGIALPDSRVEWWVSKIIQSWKDTGRKPFVLSIGTESLINEFRIRVRRDELKCDEVVVEFNDEILLVHEDGRLSFWPEGFCDLIQKQLTELAQWK